MTTEKTILLVEDHPIVQKFTADCLKRYGCHVTVAGTQKAAILESQQRGYSLILMDIGLPDGSGWAVLETIRSERNGLNLTTPIVIISAHVSEEKERALCDRLQVNMVITKPLRYEQISLLLSLIE